MEVYYGRFIDHLNKKHSINEFKPHYNQATELRYFSRLSNKKMQEQFDFSKRAAMDRNSILALFNENAIQLARGRASKNEKNEGLPVELSHFSTEITMPRTYMMHPDQYDWDMKIRIQTN